MEKRLTRMEMLFSLGFLFTLVLAVAAFFYGVKIGSEKTESKYSAREPLKSDSGVQVSAYQQQDLVSFYHTVFLPYREFQNDWFETMEKLRIQRTSDPSSSFKELAKQARKQYGIISAASVPAILPLLKQSQLDTLKSLKLFEQTANRHSSSDDAKQPSRLAEELQKDAYYQEAVKHAVLAQKDYYESMLKWSASVDPAFSQQFETSKLLEIKEWKNLPLIVKNKVMADQLATRNALTIFYPHDLSARTDEFIASGQASQMKVKTVSAVVDLLLGTKAVRTGDFSAGKASLYENELLPQLPFFFPEIK